MLSSTFVLWTFISGVSENVQGTFPLLRGGADHREQITGSSMGTAPQPQPLPWTGA